MPTRIVTNLPYSEFEVSNGNFDKSRAPVIDRIVIHTTVSSAQSAMDHFGQYGTQVSAHYVIGLDGKLYHGLEETFTAYHCGSYSMNQRSIGIEHEDNGDYNGVRPDTLYTESALLVRDICTFYSIPIDRQHIIKHSEVIPTGCPDALDIDRIVREAQIPVDYKALYEKTLALCQQIKIISYGGGWSWNKIAAIKALLIQNNI